MKGDRVEIVVAADDGSRTYEIVATRAGRRVEVTTGRGVAEVVEVTRTGEPVRTARFMASRVVALVEHPASEISGSAAALRVDGPIGRIPRSLSSITVEPRWSYQALPGLADKQHARAEGCDPFVAEGLVGGDKAGMRMRSSRDHCASERCRCAAGRQMSTTLSSGHDGSRRSRQPPLRVLYPKVRVHARMPGNGQAAVLRAAQRGTGSEVQRRALVSSLRPSSTTQRVCP